MSRCTRVQAQQCVECFKHLRTHECVGQPLLNVVDWTVMRALMPVKDRKQHDWCRACATTSSLESDGFIVTGNMSPLSEQQPVNCDTVDSDCNGCPFEQTKRLSWSLGLASASMGGHRLPWRFARAVGYGGPWPWSRSASSSSS